MGAIAVQLIRLFRRKRTCFRTSIEGDFEWRWARLQSRIRVAKCECEEVNEREVCVGEMVWFVCEKEEEAE